MGIKKIARPMNRAKNAFVEWLKSNDVELLDEFEGDNTDDEWDYYRSVDGFVNDDLYLVVFMVWNGEEKIDYKDESVSYSGMSIDEFIDLMDFPK